MLWWPSASSHICDSADRRGPDRAARTAASISWSGTPRHSTGRRGPRRPALGRRSWADRRQRRRRRPGALSRRRDRVWQPERLDFAAGAVCGEDLVQRRGAPVLIPGAIEIVDTRIALPDDPAVSQARCAKHGAGPGPTQAGASSAAREAYLDTRARALLSPERGDDPVKVEAARAVVRRAVENARAGGRFPRSRSRPRPDASRRSPSGAFSTTAPSTMAG